LEQQWREADWRGRSRGAAWAAVGRGQRVWRRSAGGSGSGGWKPGCEQGGMRRMKERALLCHILRDEGILVLLKYKFSFIHYQLIKEITKPEGEMSNIFG
jgi:hypothetical protein